MANSTWPVVEAPAAEKAIPRHSVLVRLTHWIATICALALLVSGMEIVISHPRFYWGETGNPMTPSLFDIPIPASRPWVNTGYNYVLPDQNGWSRNLHFEAAWIIVFTGLAYVMAGLIGGHFRKSMVPSGVTRQALISEIADHLRVRKPRDVAARSYNTLQRVTYLLVIFVLFPLAIWTGLAMSPAVTSMFPFLATSFGGFQSARTIHFFVSLSLVLFLFVHVMMVWRVGFRNRMRGMITGRVAAGEQAHE